MKTFLILLVTASLGSGCTDDTVDVSTFAIDTDGSGAVDCADLDHVSACLHDPHSAACTVADVNHDGAVNDADLHDIHAGLEAAGHHCTDPGHHDGNGDPTPTH